MNKVILYGRLATDPVEIAHESNPGARLFLAVDNPVMRKRAEESSNGEGRSADFFNVAVFGAQAASVLRFKKQGDEILIEARLSDNRYEEGGERRKSVEIIASRVQFVGRRAGGSSDEPNAAEAREPVAAADPDDIPF